MSKQRKIQWNYPLNRPFNCITNSTQFVGERVRNLIKASLIRNVSQLHFWNNTQTKDTIDTFMNKIVTIDTHKIDVIRTNNKVTSINPITNSKTVNGMPRNIRNRRGYAFKKDNVFMPIYVYNYKPALPPNNPVPMNANNVKNNQPTSNNRSNIHKNHAIAAFKSGNVLYCFNPWGENYNITGEILPDNLIWEHLRKLYNCDKMFVYTGPNFQQLNTRGVCVILGIEFGSHMYNYILMKQLIFGVPNMTFNQTERLGQMIYSVKYNKFVEYLFKNFAGALSNGRSCNLKQFTYELTDKLTSFPKKTKSAPLPKTNNRKRKVSTGGFMKDVNKLVSRDPNFNNAMNKSKWLAKSITNNMVASRAQVREHIRNKLSKYKNLNGNTMNSMLKQYQRQNIVLMMEALSLI